MEIRKIQNSQWEQVKTIYMEAFPKAERKPFSLIQRAVRKGKSDIWLALDGEIVAGFIVVVPYCDMVMVEYLAVSNQVRSQGTGSKLLAEVCRQYTGHRILLMIEQIDKKANNFEQRTARKRFYLKNGFSPSDFVALGVSGPMEVLCFGGQVSGDDFVKVQKYTLGWLLFFLSRTKVAKNQVSKDNAS